jgi:EAL domain-containing protein (putative c-di-GMP-specific phosphodiesterase class I)
VQVDLNKPRRDSDVGVTEILSWARANNVAIHALGVDNEMRKEQAIGLGAVAGRGWYFGEPAPL